MRDIRTKPHEYWYGKKLVEQAIENQLDKISWQTLKNYPYIQELNVNTVYDYVEDTGLYLYDFEKMIEVYQQEVRVIPSKIVKDKKSLGPISRLFVYRVEDLNAVWKYFKTERKPIMLEYISLKDFVNAVKGKEEFIKVRTRWYKRLEKVGVKPVDGKRKIKNKLADLTLDKIVDSVNSNAKTKAYFYNLQDLLAIAKVYKRADKLKQTKPCSDESNKPE